MQTPPASFSPLGFMHVLALETGGEALLLGNEMPGLLARAIQNGSQYYTLSYSPTNIKADGGFDASTLNSARLNTPWRIAADITAPTRSSTRYLPQPRARL